MVDQSGVGNDSAGSIDSDADRATVVALDVVTALPPTAQQQVVTTAVESLAPEGVQAAVNDLSLEQTQVVAAAAVENLPPEGVAAAVDVLSATQTQVVAAAAVEKMSVDGVKSAIENLTPEKQEVTASAAVGALTSDARTAWFADAVASLGKAERRDVIESLAPQKSGDRMAVYIAGFVAAAVLAIVFGLIACFAKGPGVRTAAISAATSVPSLVLGGLIGAFTGK